MGLHFDWTISIGSIITVAWGTVLALGFFLKVMRWIDKLDMIMDEYPPHRHVGSNPQADPLIVYPRGMKPR